MRTHIKTIFGIGIALILIPLIGFPAAWKSFFIFALGLWLCGIALLSRLNRHRGKGVLHEQEPSSPAAPFVQNQSRPESAKESLTSNNHGETQHA